MTRLMANKAAVHPAALFRFHLERELLIGVFLVTGRQT
jgi:hypothetical protein